MRVKEGESGRPGGGECEGSSSSFGTLDRMRLPVSRMLIKL